MGRPGVLAILGPTATGKSSLAVEIAHRLDGEIISADSRQVYRGLEVGTAAPTERQRAAVPHHGVAFLEPGCRFSAGEFARRARQWMAEIDARGRIPILCGGTGFFFRALTQPIFREPSLDASRRRLLHAWLRGQPGEELARWTETLDRDLVEQRGRLDRQRAERTLELALLTGRPLSWWHAEAPAEAVPVCALTFVLELGAIEHRRRIRRRAEGALEAWLEEVRALRESGHGEDSPALTAIGYRSVSALATGRISRAEALEAIVADTWRYARRQRTWFRHQLSEDSVRLDGSRATDELAVQVIRCWHEADRRAGAPDAPGTNSERAGLR